MHMCSLTEKLCIFYCTICLLLIVFLGAMSLEAFRNAQQEHIRAIRLIQQYEKQYRWLIEEVEDFKTYKEIKRYFEEHE